MDLNKIVREFREIYPIEDDDAHYFSMEDITSAINVLSQEMNKVYYNTSSSKVARVEYYSDKISKLCKLAIKFNKHFGL